MGVVNDKTKIMEYHFIDIEKKWRQQWAEMKTYTVAEDKE